VPIEPDVRSSSGASPSAVLADLQLDFVVPNRLEARQLRGHLVGASRKEIEHVKTRAVGDGLSLQAGGGGLQLHNYTRQHAAT
jgi:hypothetical protein